MLQHGVDLHKCSLTVAMVDAVDKVLACKRMPAWRGELRRYLISWKELQQATVECTLASDLDKVRLNADAI